MASRVRTLSAASPRARTPPAQAIKPRLRREEQLVPQQAAAPGAPPPAAPSARNKGNAPPSVLLEGNAALEACAGQGPGSLARRLVAVAGTVPVPRAHDLITMVQAGRAGSFRSRRRPPVTVPGWRRARIAIGHRRARFSQGRGPLAASGSRSRRAVTCGNSGPSIEAGPAPRCSPKPWAAWAMQPAGPRPWPCGCRAKASNYQTPKCVRLDQ